MDALRRGQERLKSARFFSHKVHGVARHRVSAADACAACALCAWAFVAALRRLCPRRRRFRPAHRVSDSVQHTTPGCGPSSRSCSTPSRRPPTAVYNRQVDRVCVPPSERASGVARGGAS
eukprot:4141468-Prymnesium_polylepis.1